MSNDLAERKTSERREDLEDGKELREIGKIRDTANHVRDSLAVLKGVNDRLFDLRRRLFTDMPCRDEELDKGPVPVNADLDELDIQCGALTEELGVLNKLVEDLEKL